MSDKRHDHTKRERQARYRARRQVEGLVLVQYWVHRSDAETVDQLIAPYRANPESSKAST
ncbi:hypothetical protein [Sedimenticola hydrogenitrophicus]|uniref:hypothetical protein n=1 Tax=Sedimenticola hydrogenitrophicus TaxID=2967975 RepID=UPI0023B1DE20|nr:hypothetical protein [Sedimenticola hydrogenitrophicus]